LVKESAQRLVAPLVTAPVLFTRYWWAVLLFAVLSIGLPVLLCVITVVRSPSPARRRDALKALEILVRRRR